MRIVCTIFLLLILPSSCRKDDLKGATAALVGKWKWQYSIEYRESSWSTSTSLISANDYPDEYSIEVEKNGIIRFYSENSNTNKYRVIFSFLAVENSVKYDTEFTIRLNNDNGSRFSGRFNNDSLSCSTKHLPFMPRTEGGIKYSYTNIYSKIQ